MKVKVLILFFSVLLFGAIWSYERVKTDDVHRDLSELPLVEAPACIQMYDYLVKYSKQYDVPTFIAFRIANNESGYRGPFQWDYDPSVLISSANAYGAMQIKASTASQVWNRKVKPKELLNDLEFNVETSMKLLAYLRKIGGSWEIALGYYSSGLPTVNWYSDKILRRYEK